MTTSWRSFSSAQLIRVLVVLMIALVSIGVHHTDWLKLINGKLLDAGFLMLRKAAPRPVARDVAVVGIDVEALRTFSEPRDFWHANYGRLLAALAQLRPSAVGLDVVFPERSYQHLIPGLDQSLLQGLIAMRGKVPVVLARTIDDFNNFREIFAPYIAIAGADAVGSVVVCKDEDEVMRWFDESLCGEDHRTTIPSLAGVMAKRLGVEQTWRGFIDYRIGDAVSYVPFRQIVQPTADEMEKVRVALEGRPVLVGFILPFEDRKTVPVDLARWEPGNRSVPGVLVHAQILRSMLNGGLLQPVDARVIYALCFLGAAFVLLRSGARTTVLFLAFALGLGGAMLYLLDSGHYLGTAAPSLAGIAAVSLRLVDDAIAQARERTTLRNAFGGYVSPQIMDEILAGRITPQLGGRRERVCILFSDVRNFTARSEHMQPEALIEVLNKYFTEMTQAVHAHGGTVDKFIGDGMMCFFGAPQPLANPCEAAVDAGREMLTRLEALNQRLAEQGQQPIAMGIGLHFGEVVLGHVGSEDRHEYTAIGDAVNTASRIEGLTKGVGYALVVSQDVWTELSNRQDFEELGERAVKGRSAVAIYGYKGSRTKIYEGETT